MTKFHCLIPFTFWELGNMYIVIICRLVCDVINFEISYGLRIKPFFYIIKKLGQKCKYLKNKEIF